MSNNTVQPFHAIGLMLMIDQNEDVQTAIRDIVRAEVNLILDARDKAKLPQGSPAARAQAIQERNSSIAEFVKQGKSRQEVAVMFSLSLDRVNQIMRNFPATMTDFPKPKPKLTPEQKAQNKQHYADWGIEDDDIDELIENKLSGQIYLDIWNGNTPEATAKRYNVTVAQAKNCYHHEDNLRNKKK